MKAWCASCDAVRQVPFSGPREAYRCEECGRPLRSMLAKTARQREQSRTKPPQRDWRAAREKVEIEEFCRLARHADCSGPLESAHVIGRDRDAFTLDGDPLERAVWHVESVRIVPLCKHHHGLYDFHRVDLLPALKLEEEVQAVRDAGGIELARVRTAPTAYVEVRSAA